ncbi:MAG: sensor histidine kinase [Bryobacteraceae bacterium]
MLARLYRLQVRELEDVAMFVTDPQGMILTWNRAIELIFGYGEEEWLGQQAHIIFTEEDRFAGVPEKEMAGAEEKGRTSDIRWHLRKDGSRVFMVGILKCLRDDDGELLGFTKVIIDDTARKRLEDALTESNADLQQFAFVASHDLQEPLRTIIAFAQLLDRRSGDQLGREGRELVASITHSAQRMSSLIRDLLDYSRLSYDEADAGSVHLDEDIESAVSLLRSSIEDSGAVITHDSLPNVQLSRGQMVRVFQNLLSNAIKFRKPEQKPVIHVSAEAGNNEWIIRVHDNGIGFAPEHAELIFAPFKRLHSVKQFPGSGIGLATCKRIVERFGGRIGADSQPGRGSIFWFTIPAERITEELVARQESPPAK